ncbi:LacI family DNA-binding transcriptional regulator [Microbacterium sp. zg-YB36]|uniref:LacI family DNA-binding transcriptional regulator n=1 Tax=Microbacterium sp. zg-YB36 TaxID=2969407 RepID=UPI00214B0D5B|nr:LacI family DNA-binding transcriptional regulator [Microbacterium sp. zg-YB36]MDL5352247.1 LacI family DNA-binding transcriptional regulator [Microbacterium sp. zg-YB36]
MVSIDEVARAAGVSTATVSRALSGRGQVSDDTRSRVLATAAALGYVVSASASSLASGRTRNIGVLLPVVDRWYFSTVLAGIASGLQRAGYDITLYALTEDAGERATVFETFLRRRRVDAVIAIAISLDATEVERVVELGLPVVALGAAHPRLPSLSVDDVAVARVATGHLTALGHRDIAHIGTTPEYAVDDAHIPTQRRRGFEQALADAGIPPASARHEYGDFTIEGGHRAAMRLLRGERPPTAIFAASDEMAIGALIAARDLGLDVPGDLSVVGVDGHELSGFFGLTTVDQFPHGQGLRAAAAVLAELEATVPVVPLAALPFELVVRASTAPPTT